MTDTVRSVVFVGELSLGDTVVVPCLGPGMCRVKATTHRTRPQRRDGAAVAAEHQLTISRFGKTGSSGIRTAIVVDEDGEPQPWQAWAEKAIHVIVTIPPATSEGDI